MPKTQIRIKYYQEYNTLKYVFFNPRINYVKYVFHNYAVTHCLSLMLYLLFLLTQIVITTIISHFARFASPDVFEMVTVGHVPTG